MHIFSAKSLQFLSFNSVINIVPWTREVYWDWAVPGQMVGTNTILWGVGGSKLC